MKLLLLFKRCIRIFRYKILQLCYVEIGGYNVTLVTYLVGIVVSLRTFYAKHIADL